MNKQTCDNFEGKLMIHRDLAESIRSATEDESQKQKQE